MPYANAAFTIFETLGFLSFAVILAREIYARNTLRVFEIVSCLAFGMLLEICNIYLTRTYYYGPGFSVQVMGVPLAIGCGWTVIIYCAMLLSDQYNVPWMLRPCMDALTALTLDLSMDAIAIRLGFWHWMIPLNAEWYGVPFDNLAAWLFVAFSFSFIVRFIRTLNPDRRLTQLIMAVSPLLAYLGLWVGLMLYSAITIIPYVINNISALSPHTSLLGFSILTDPQIQLWKLIILVAIIVELVNITVTAAVKYRRNYLQNFDALSFLILTGLHLFFFFAMIATGIYRELPILIVLSIAMFLVHLAVHFVPYLLNPKTIYLFKKVRRSLKEENQRIEAVIDTALR